jgi:flagellar protein FliS
MLFQELLGNIASAKGEIEQGNIAKKGERISKAITIISVLEGSIDFENGGEISNNLAALYSYSAEKLLEANINSDTAILDDVIKILLPIKNSWDAIPNEEQDAVSF